jgi:hypothetical protein
MIQIEISGNKRTMNNAINEITVAEFEQLCVILNGDDEDVFDRYLKVFGVLGLTDEEIDVITPSEFIDLTKTFTDEDWECKEFKPTIEVDGVVYTAYSGSEFKLSVRDLAKIEKYIKQDNQKYMGEMLAVIYKNLTLDRMVHYEDSHIKSKAELFRSKVTADVILPYVNLILKDIVTKLKGNDLTK